MTVDYRRDLQKAAELLDTRRLAEAKPLLDGLIGLRPLDPYVLYNMGLWYWHMQQPREALPLWRRAIGADPGLLPAIVNLSSALYAMGDLREALRYCQMAVRRKPGDAQLLSNLSQVLTGLGEAKDALDAVNDALNSQPDHLPSLIQRMIILTDMGKLKPAIEAGEAVLQHPQGAASVEALNNLTSLASKFSDWTTLERYHALLEAAARAPQTVINPMALTFSFDDPELLGALAHRRASKMAETPQRPARQPSIDGRISIAYLSPDLREHPVAHMVLEILRHHDRAKFAVFTIGTLPDDASPLAKEIARYTDGHIDLTKLDDSQAAMELRRRGIDVLVDLAGTTKWCRPGILARRPCPAQILWLGCPCTTGTHYYDAFLVDDTVAPLGYEAHCTEPLVRLPCCYHPISLGFGSPSTNITRARARLPEGKRIVGVLQQPNKIRPPLIDKIVEVVARHDHTHLWVRVHQDGIPSAQQRFVKAGLPIDRQHFAMLYHNRDDYLAIYGLVDIIVDSFPYGGHSTTGEALIQGTPVLTIAGRSIHTRVAASMLHELGLDDLIMPDFPTMQRTLDTYLNNTDRLSELQRRCQAAAENHRQRGAQRLTHALEQAYTGVLSQAPKHSTAP